MKTEDLKNYIFEQLNETSDALKRKLLHGRFQQSMRAHDTAYDISQENQKIFKKTGTFNPSLHAARDVIGNRAVKAGKSYLKTNNRLNGLMGDGSPRTSKQESAFNFINGLKELTENSRRRKDANNSAQQKRYGWTHKDTRVQDYADKMYPEPDDVDDVSEFENEQLQGRRNEAELALRRREDPYNIKRNIRDMLFRIKK